MNPFGVTEQKAQALADRMSAAGILESDLEESFIRSGGPGGQHVNRTATCVLLKHGPSGQQVKMQRARSQGLNRYYARKRLCELLESDRSGSSREDERAAKIRKQKSRRKRRSTSGRPAENEPGA